jgi:hypothetical protein
MFIAKEFIKAAFQGLYVYDEENNLVDVLLICLN